MIAPRNSAEKLAGARTPTGRRHTEASETTKEKSTQQKARQEPSDDEE